MHPATDSPEHYAATGPVYFYGGPFSSFAKFPFTAGVRYYEIDRFEQPLTSRRYATREHFFQAAKAIDKQAFEQVLLAPGPFAAKTRGHTILLREDWEQVKFQVMLDGVICGCEQNPKLRRALLGTGDRPIAEDSPTDDVWGIRDEIGRPRGLNLLGVALMAARHMLRSAEEPLEDALTLQAETWPESPMVSVEAAVRRP